MSSLRSFETPPNMLTHLTTREERLLLSVILDSPDKARESWESWRQTLVLDSMSPASRRLLPRLYKRLMELGVSDECLGKLKGTYRHTWATNTKILQTALRVADEFDKRQITYRFLKGIPILLNVYGDIALRPMSDFDILVREEDAERAAAVLRTMNYSPKDGWPKLRLDFDHGVGFVDGNGSEVDLHWHVLPHCCSSEFDEAFWEKPLWLDYGDRKIPCLNHTQQLLVMAVHLIDWDPTRHVRYTADLVTFLRVNEAHIDWASLRSMAQSGNFTTLLQTALAFIAEDFGGLVPESTLSQLTHLRRPSWERGELEVMAHWPTPYYRLLRRWYWFKRSRYAAKSATAAIGFAHYLYDFFDTRRIKLIPYYLEKRTRAPFLPSNHQDNIGKCPLI